MSVARCLLAMALATGGLLSAVAVATEPPVGTGTPFPDTIPAERLTAAFWIDRAAACDTVLLDAAAVSRQNAGVLAAGPGLHDLARLPERLSRDEVLALITGVAAGNKALPVVADPTAAVPDLETLVARDAIPAEVAPRFALAVRRADLRTFPTDLPGRAKPTDTDIDRFQESALFPGTPVAILHTSADGRYAFVVAPHYAAWVAGAALAEGERTTVLGFAGSQPRRVVTGPTARVVVAPPAGAAEEIVVDMGVSLPEVTDWPLGQPLAGQGTLAATVVRFPSRGADGKLVLPPALLPRGADSHPGPLPASRANLLRQAFKFLGERYCWGHRGGGRDCSGFVGECYRSLGLVIPRNSRDQAACTASFGRTAVAPHADREARLKLLGALEPGDLVHVPGHVMMVIGHDGGGPWIIHDSHAATVRGPDGRPRRLPTNSVVISPLEPLLRDDGRSVVEAVTVVQRYLPPSPAR